MRNIENLKDRMLLFYTTLFIYMIQSNYCSFVYLRIIMIKTSEC